MNDLKFLAAYLKILWNRFWFSPHHPYDLCLPRPLFYLMFIYYFDNNTYYDVGWIQYAQTAPWMPISFFKLLPFHVPSREMFQSLQLVWRIAAVFSVVGLCTRFSTMTLFLVSIYLFGFRYNYGKIDNITQLPLVIAGILAFSRCGDYFSIDWLLHKYFGKDEKPVKKEFYRWPVILARTYITLIYFEAGYQKFWHSGWNWATAENIQVIILTRPTVTEMGVWASQFPALCQAIATITLLGELGAPLALLNPYLAVIFIPTLFFFHVGTFALMGYHGYFLPYHTAYVFWVPWVWLKNKIIKPKS